VNRLSGATWVDAQKLASEREMVATALPAIITADMHFVEQLTENVSSSDLLKQSIYQGLLTAAERGTDCREILMKFFEKVTRISDPPDIPDGFRLWVMRDTMLLNLAIRIVRNVEHRELTADEVVEVCSDPVRWIKRVYPATNAGATSPSPISDDVKTSFPRGSKGDQVTPPDQPPALQKAPPTSPTSILSEEPTSSTSWSASIVLIVATCGLLWLLSKRRS